MRKLLLVMAGLFVVGASMQFAPAPVQAQTTDQARRQACLGAGGNIAADGSCVEPGGTQLPDVVKRVVNILVFLVGAVAVIMLVIGGFRYALSGGDPEGTRSAKDTIMYALIGLVVAFLAYAAVNFVIGRLRNPSTAPPVSMAGLHNNFSQLQ